MKAFHDLQSCRVVHCSPKPQWCSAQAEPLDWNFTLGYYNMIKDKNKFCITHLIERSTNKIMSMPMGVIIDPDHIDEWEIENNHTHDAILRNSVSGLCFQLKAAFERVPKSSVPHFRPALMHSGISHKSQVVTSHTDDTCNSQNDNGINHNSQTMTSHSADDCRIHSDNGIHHNSQTMTSHIM